MTPFEQALEDLEWHKAVLDFKDRLSSIIIQLNLIEEQVNEIAA